MSDPRTEAAVKRLESTHWDGTGCGTNSDMGCAHCYGPSPADAHEIVRDVLAAADEADRAAGVARSALNDDLVQDIAAVIKLAPAGDSSHTLAASIVGVLRQSVEGRSE